MKDKFEISLPNKLKPFQYTYIPPTDLQGKVLSHNRNYCDSYWDIFCDPFISCLGQAKMIMMMIAKKRTNLPNLSTTEYSNIVQVQLDSSKNGLSTCMVQKLL